MDLQTAKAIPELDEVQIADDLQEINLLQFADEEPVRQSGSRCAILDLVIAVIFL